jgi:hypothetical protein
MSPSAFTGAAPDDRFRFDDTWRGPDGRIYRVANVIQDTLVYLRPVGHDGAPMHLNNRMISGWLRVSWGGRH